MQYIGLQSQISRNNMRSVLLLICFPVLIISLLWLFIFLFTYASYTGEGLVAFCVDTANAETLYLLPYVLLGVVVWFVIAFLFHSAMIKRVVGSHTLERKDNMRVYNLVENLCISKGMQMPKLQIMETEALNAFASGISEKTYTVTLTRGIIERLDDDELEGVIAHELSHIQNKDVRLLIVSIIFVGIFSFLTSMLLRMFIFGGGRRKKQDGRVMLIALLVAVVGYLITILLKFALSRKREYMADAGAAEMTHKPHALASALRKISGNSQMPEVKTAEVAQLYIDNTPSSSSLWGRLSGLLSSHPPIEKRIAFLEQM